MQNWKLVLDEKFPQNVSDLLVSCVQKAYLANSDCHDPNLGHDEMSFGLLNFKTIKRFISDLATDQACIAIEKHAPQFLFRINGFRMSHYRVGDPFDLDPSESFPKNRGGATLFARHNRDQLSLFNLWDEKTFPSSNGYLPEVILAHSGNYEFGLSQIFLGIPADFDDLNRITRWEETKQLWNRMDGDLDLGVMIPPSDPTPPLEPMERISPPALSLSIKKDRRKES